MYIQRTKNIHPWKIGNNCSFMASKIYQVFWGNPHTQTIFLLNAIYLMIISELQIKGYQNNRFKVQLYWTYGMFIVCKSKGQISWIMYKSK